LKRPLSAAAAGPGRGSRQDRAADRRPGGAQQECYPCPWLFSQRCGIGAEPVPTVRVVPYDARWPNVFRLQSQRLLECFEHGLASIHHIGSTSVPGLCAKPVIDVLIETDDLATFDRATDCLEERGYGARGEYGVPGRRYFSRPATATELKVHVHGFSRGSRHAADHLRFRDHLRAHPAVAARYCDLKRRLAAEHRGDASAYQAGKTEFIERVEPPVAAWRPT
jgi:GrpB-like predicted nucleotidyltransferase (UPF0157 family)